MIQAVSSETARQNRKAGKGRSTGFARWRTEYMGNRAEDGQVIDRPQAFLVELAPQATISAHFHVVDEFQVMVAGNGMLGRNPTPAIALHYVDHHTAYGPITAGPFGLSFFTFRAQSDTGSVTLNAPGYKDLLKPSKKRYLLRENLPLSTEPVLQNRSDAAIEKVFDELQDDGDGLGASMLRLGASQTIAGPDPKKTGGQFYLVLSGSLRLRDATYPRWSTVYLGPSDAPLQAASGTEGMEALILSFPRVPS